MSSRTCRTALALATAATAIAIPFTFTLAAHAASPPQSYRCLEGPRVGSVTINGAVSPSTVGSGCTTVFGDDGVMFFANNPEPFLCKGVISIDGTAAGENCQTPD
ncbi:hypothetical protein [Streptosporangium subroseum]|uniref:hypothetical protein n=1 Tax=Streptosporangium subroseum TaxID=106412 RepID=UPI00308B648F|nr:hypothetical protein OHB15_36230 [Streptosporangium subroseum]